MPENSLKSENNIRIAFNRVKEDILAIENRLNKTIKLFLEQNKNISYLKEEMDKILRVLKEIKAKKDVSGEASIGNKGVYSFIHSFTMHSNEDKNLNFSVFKEDFEALFKRLTNKEFLTFLAIYQLEEDLGKVTYTDISHFLKLSEGCIRTYVSSLLKKKAPIIKQKHNNRQVNLSLFKEFRDLGLKNKLFNIYHNRDPDQKRLTEPF